MKKDLGPIPLRFSSLFKNCLWTLSCYFAPHGLENIETALIATLLNAGVILMVTVLQKRGCLLGTGPAKGVITVRGGGGGGESEGSTARTDPEDRGGRGPPPEQWKCYGGVPSPLRSN